MYIHAYIYIYIRIYIYIYIYIYIDQSSAFMGGKLTIVISGNKACVRYFISTSLSLESLQQYSGCLFHGEINNL